MLEHRGRRLWKWRRSILLSPILAVSIFSVCGQPKFPPPVIPVYPLVEYCDLNKNGIDEIIVVSPHPIQNRIQLRIFEATNTDSYRCIAAATNDPEVFSASDHTYLTRVGERVLVTGDDRVEFQLLAPIGGRKRRQSLILLLEEKNLRESCRRICSIFCRGMAVPGSHAKIGVPEVVANNGHGASGFRKATESR
jgi:hypothetical protein